MLTIENIYNSRSLERHSEGIYINNQRMFSLAPIKDNNKHPKYYMMFTAHIINGQPVLLEKVIAHKHKKIRVSMIPLRNDEKWS